MTSRDISSHWLISPMIDSTENATPTQSTKSTKSRNSISSASILMKSKYHFCVPVESLQGDALAASSLETASVSVCIYVTWLLQMWCTDESMTSKDMSTRWRRPVGCLKLQVIFRKGATDYRALLRKMTYEDKASYGRSSLATASVSVYICVTWLLQMGRHMWRDSIHMCDMTHSHVGHDSFTCVTWLIHMSDMTQSSDRIRIVWHDLFRWDSTSSDVRAV